MQNSAALTKQNVVASCRTPHLPAQQVHFHDTLSSLTKIKKLPAGLIVAVNHCKQFHRPLTDSGRRECNRGWISFIHTAWDQKHFRSRSFSDTDFQTGDTQSILPIEDQSHSNKKGGGRLLYTARARWWNQNAGNTYAIRPLSIKGHKLIHLCLNRYFYLFYFFIYFERQRETDRKDLSFTSSLPKSLQQLGIGQAEVERWEFNAGPPLASREPTLWAIACCFPRCGSARSRSQAVWYGIQ